VGTRQRLNREFVNGSFLLAVGAGWLAQSGLVFFVALVLLLGLNLVCRQSSFDG
jgi:hypothetical protein